MVSFSDFRIVTGIDGIIGKALPGSAEGIANLESQFVVDQVFAAVVALVEWSFHIELTKKVSITLCCVVCMG